MKSEIKKILPVLRELYYPFRRAFAFSLVLITTIQILGVVSPYIFTVIVDRLYAKAPFDQVAWIFAALAVSMLFERLILPAYREMYELYKIDHETIGHTFQFVFRRIMQFSAGQHTSFNSAKRISVMDRGIAASVNMMRMLLYQLVPTLVMIVAVFVALMIKSPVLAAVYVLGATTYFAQIYWVNLKTWDGARKLERMSQEDGKLTKEFVNNATLVATNAQQKRAKVETDESWKRLSSHIYPYWTRMIWYWSGQLATALVFNLVVLILGIKYVYAGELTVGGLLACMSWANAGLNAMSNLNSMQKLILKNATVIERLYLMIMEEPDVKEAAKAVDLKIEGRVEFRNVSYRYDPRISQWMIDPDDPEANERLRKTLEKKRGDVLSGVSFTVRPGEHVAIVGHSGAGKSTLVRLLTRGSDPQSGSILIDGVDLRQLKLDSYLEQVGVVEQSVQLLDNSLRYNAVFCREVYESRALTDKELDSVCKMTCLDELVSQDLEAGYDTFIGERGIKLSGGQGQRVGIARALIKNPKIVIFDEATSNLDAITERAIKDALTSHFVGRTVFIVAHRLSTVRDADKIVVLDKGKVVGIGKHEDLMLSCPVYYNLVKHQTEFIEDEEEAKEELY